MKKLKIFLAVACLMVTVAAQPAFAANTSYKFKFNSINDIQPSDYGEKDDNSQYWYLSLDSYNDYYNRSNTLSASNIFGCRLHRDDYDSIDTYRLHKSYGSSFKYHYNTSTSKGESMFLKGQKDDSSTSPYTLYVSGRFCP